MLTKLGSMKLTLTHSDQDVGVTMADNILELEAGREWAWSLSGYQIEIKEGEGQYRALDADTVRLGTDADEQTPVLHWSRLGAVQKSGKREVISGTVPLDQITEIRAYMQKYISTKPPF